jgi:chromosome segregation ATPase
VSSVFARIIQDVEIIMSSKNKRLESSEKVNEAISKYNDSKLLKFDESNTVSTGNDINAKITSLDTDLAHLRNELGSINSSVEEGLDRLGDTDTDLTAKVSETYKRLGEIDNSYKSLLEISSRIDRDIRKLNGDVSTVAEQSASGIKNLEQSTIAQSHDFTQKNQLVASRVSQLVETSKLTNDLLEQKIHTTTESILYIEKRIVSEIENLSSITNEKTKSIKSSVDSNKAKILKLQSVDEAIIRRATTLEITSAELNVASQRLDSSVVQLELSSDVLTHGIDTLKERTTELEKLTNNHSSLIGGLQKAGVELSDKIVALADRENKRFNIVSIGFLLLLVVTAVLYFAQQDQFGTSDAKFVEHSEIVDHKFVSLQQDQIVSVQVTNDSLATLEEKIAQVDYKMQGMEDQVQSVEGRLSQSSPFSGIGDDNVLHGSQWIAELPKENFVVQLAYTDNKAAMYETAQRYNHYLKDSLSYFEVENEGLIKYVLLSGNYATQEKAQVAIQDMPTYIDMQLPQVKSVETIQAFIAQ